MTSHPRAWGITDGSAGMVAQVKALAKALGTEIEIKTIKLRKPFAYLPNAVFASPLRNIIVPAMLDAASDPLEAPWPELVISCGRKGALVAMGLRAKLASRESRFIHIQDPQVSSYYFDLVVAMEHDRIEGANVIKTRFALHSITPEILDDARGHWANSFASYPSPRVAVLLGGSTNKYRLNERRMAHVVLALQRLQEATGASLLITPSRRTGEDNVTMLKAALTSYIYDFTGDNPYLGLLACADYIVVTNDSVNMMSEACATGKPVYILPLPGHHGTKPARFAEMLIRQGMVRRLEDRLDIWQYAVPDEMEAIKARIQLQLNNH